MPKRTTSYRDRLLQRLSSPEEAAHYLNAAFDDSTEVFLEALRDVAQARQMSAVATQAGVKRETIYRAFSKTGNPTLDTLNSVLGVCGLQLNVAASGRRSSKGEPSDSGSSAIRLHRTAKTGSRSRITHETARQMAFDFGMNSIANTEVAHALQLSSAFPLPKIYYLNQEQTAPLVPIDLLVASAANREQIWKE